MFCYKKELFSKAQIDGFELLLFNIIMPFYLFASCYKIDLSVLLNTRYIIASLITFGVLAIIITAMFVKNLSAISVCMRILASSCANVSMYILPVITILLKDPTAAIIGNIVQVIIIQPILIILISILKHQKKSLTKKIISFVTTPLIIIPIAGILLNYLQINLPAAILDAISQIGSGSSGLALFTFGLALGATNISAQCLKFDLLSIVFVKHLINPLVAICVAYCIKLESYWFNSLVIFACAPTAFLVYLISKQFSTEEELVKKVVALSSVVAMVSLIPITMVIGLSI
jgi:predicted permease